MLKISDFDAFKVTFRTPKGIDTITYFSGTEEKAREWFNRKYGAYEIINVIADKHHDANRFGNIVRN